MTSELLNLHKLDLPNLSWHDDALCRQFPIEWFFDTYPSRAKKICAECPVKALCLDWILEIEKMVGKQDGVYGGASCDERYRKLRRCKLPGCNKTPQEKGASYCSPEHHDQHVLPAQAKRKKLAKQLNNTTLEIRGMDNREYHLKGRVRA